jgi:xanthine dehydrogenase accessory factor
MERYSEIYAAVQKEIDKGNKAVLITDLNSHAAVSEQINKKLMAEQDLADPGRKEYTASELAKEALKTGRLQPYHDQSGRLFIAEPYFPESRLIILGGGHIAKPLAEFGAKCGFSVTVVDDRIDFANDTRFPLAHRVICESFDRCVPLLNINKSTFVVIITRGHRHDIDCLREILPLETAYTGMIGSKRRVRAAMEQLMGEGLPHEKLKIVRAPIGLDIGGITPEEIAVSILAELIQYKRKKSETNWPELDKNVLDELSLEQSDPRAIVTIIETKGSVPRDLGAKMIVWADGRTIGSIGGGCSEGEVIGVAYDVIRNGGYEIVDVDMTGEVAENEGMVCGGTMKVLIEKCD